MATLYKIFRHPPYGHVIKIAHVQCAPRPAGPGDFSYYSSVLSPEVDESTIQLPTLLLVVGAEVEGPSLSNAEDLPCGKCS